MTSLWTFLNQAKCLHKAANVGRLPFLYCGNPRFEGWEGEKPITITWELAEAVPAHLRKSLGVQP